MPPAAAAGGAVAAAAGAAGGAEGQPQQQRGGGFMQSFVRMIMMYYMFKMFTGSGNKGGQAPGGPGGKGAAQFLTPQFPRGQPLDCHLYVSEAADWRDAAAAGTPVWTAGDVPLAEPGVVRQHSHVYRPSPAVHNNGSVFVHAVFTLPGASPNPTDDFYDRAATFARTKPLNVYLRQRAAKDGVNLLSGKNSTDGEAPPADVAASPNATLVISYLKPNVTVHMVDDFSRHNAAQVPPQYAGLIAVDNATGTYAPHIWFNDFWLLRDHLLPVNDTLTEVTLHFELSSMTALKYMIMSQMEQSFSMQKHWGAMADGESDEVKRIFLESNPLFLGLTIAVSLLHSVFDMLAFTNDIGFWKNNKSMKGLSARSILINAGCQIIIFFYLLDNDTSMVILFSTGIGCAIELWKVTKAMDVSVVRTASGLPWLSVKDRGSYVSSKTDQYDAEAMRYLSYALYPLVAGYAVYALLYRTHKSWYSWVLNSLVGAVYAFGFILMCPQLYLNYKLKSVAHLPWRQMSYKFLNTIIDDLFAFVIKMPLMHRLSVFRDDIVFLVYLYQRWIYRVDKKRTNEFGYVEEPPEEGEGEGEDEAAAALVTKDDGRPEGSVRQRMAAAAADGATAAAAAAKEESKEEEAAEEAAVAEPKKDK